MPPANLDARGAGGDDQDEKAEEEISTPTSFKRNVHVKVNPETGALEGLPDEWHRALSADGSRSRRLIGAEGGREQLSRLLPTNLALRLKDWWNQRVGHEREGEYAEDEEEQNISAPFNVQHLNHVVVDHTSETGEC